jgi:ferric-chelate reductase
LHTFENIIFIVGGTGISGALPYMHEHIKSIAQDAQAAGTDRKRSTCTKDITFVWSTKQSAMIRDVAAHELKPFLERNDIHIHLHATSGADKSSADGDKECKIIPSVDVGDDITVVYGRPDIQRTILNVIGAVNSSGATSDRIAILTCGPAGMADEARAAVHKALKQGNRGVEYIEETFG